MYIYFFAEVSVIIYKNCSVLCVGSQFVAMVLVDHCEIVLELDGSMRYTCVPFCWSLLDNISGLYVRRKRRTVLIRTPCGPIIDGMRYPPNRPVPVHDGSFILLPNDRFAVVRLSVLAVTLRGPPVPDADPLEMYYDSNSDSGHG